MSRKRWRGSKGCKIKSLTAPPLPLPHPGEGEITDMK
jgi:hypothetical protein